MWRKDNAGCNNVWVQAFGMVDYSFNFYCDDAHCFAGIFFIYICTAAELFPSTHHTKNNLPFNIQILKNTTILAA
jgi:hypothetical protein